MVRIPWRRRVPAPAAPPRDDAAETAAGWDAITGAFETAYPGQEPFHYGTLVKYRLGGPDPLDGVSVYRAADPVPHWHYVTYGYSDLYGEAGRPHAPEEADSGYGIEMTLRLADPAALDPAASPPVWVVNLLQNLARYVFRTGNVILARHHLDTDGPIAVGVPTRLCALAFIDDPISPPLSTPHGAVRLVQAVGITADELRDAVAWNTAGVLDVLAQRWPRGLTILDRPSLDDDPDLVRQVREGTARDGSGLDGLSLGTLDLAGTPTGIRVTLAAQAMAAVTAAAGGRLGAGGELTLAGPAQALVLLPQPDDGGAERTLPDPDQPGRLSLTGAGVAGLAELPALPGDYRLDAIPWVVWRLVDDGS